MSIEVTESYNTLTIKGELNRKSTEELSARVQKMFRPNQSICVNLEQVHRIDAHAAYALMKLFIKSMGTNSTFYVNAMKNKLVLQVLEETDTLNIWIRAQRLI